MIRLFRDPTARYSRFRWALTMGTWFGLWYSRPLSFGVWVGPHRMSYYSASLIGSRNTDLIPGLYFSDWS